ncbi:toxin-antitoxin system YwqK family antitoxin [Bacteroidota bacterium]
MNKLRIHSIYKSIGFLIALYCSMIGMSAQDEVPENGYVKFYYPSGQLASEGTMRDGKPDAYWITYYPSGVKKSEGKRTNFMLDSLWTFYDNKGDTLQRISYMFGKKNGYHLVYSYENQEEGRDFGVVISRELYVNDQREGISYYYFKDGNMRSEVSFVNGKRQGISREYNSEGTIQSLKYFHDGYLTDKEEINRLDQNGYKQGVWKEFYPDRKLKTERSYRDNVLDGLYKEFNEKGNLVMVMKYEKGQVVAENISDEESIEIRNEYDDRNRLVKSGPFRQNIPVGIHREYDQDGKITNARTYDNIGRMIAEGLVDEEGKKQGRWMDYYPEGEKKSEGLYTNNYRTGKWRFYRRSGRIEQTGDYNQGRPHGLWLWYYENGSPLREEYFYHGREDGTLIEYSPQGGIITRGDFIDGEREGEWYYREGDHVEVGNYITGLRDGRWKHFYGDSTLKFEGYYIQGNADGKHKLFYQNGVLKEERYYVMGIREKSWKKYDDAGNLKLTITYKNDVETRVNGAKVDLPEGTRTLIQ